MSHPNIISSSKIQDETNKRIYMRNVPSAPLQPYLDVRPSSSKYSFLPIVEPHRISFNVPLKKYPTYNIKQTFYPGDAMAPYSGYAANIDIETELKGQLYALQKSSQAVYVPNLESDLFNTKVVYQIHSPDSAAAATHMPHALLFKNYTYNKNDKYTKCIENMAPLIWGNNTRAQCHNMSNDFNYGNGLFQTMGKHNPLPKI